MKRNMICIGCPMGCELTAEVENGAVISVSGNGCAVGKRYAETEVTAPTRMVTTTAIAENGTPIPVKTKSPVPKDKIFDVVKAIKAVTVKLPVHMGDIIIADAADTGIPIISCGGVAASRR